MVRGSKAEYGRPIADWRNESEYVGYPEGVRWGWEFLRRNPGYQDLWESEIPQFSPRASHEDQWHYHYYIACYDILAADIKLLDGTTTRGQQGIFGVDTCCGEAHLVNAFGISNLLNPYATSITDGLLRYQLVNRLYSSSVGDMQQKQKTVTISNIPGHHLVYVFDLSESIQKQLDEAKQKLNEQKRAIHDFVELPTTITKLRFQNFPDYIRVLDARASGLSIAKISATMFGSRKGNVDDFVKDTIRQSLRYRDQLYRRLLI